MNALPRVSVIMPFLNMERFIEESIQSVVAQTYREWELLVVDDGSNDRSTDIAKRYAQQHPNHVRYLDHPNHENRGASAARNLGLRNARGEFIAFLDGDDVWLPRKLEEQVAILSKQPAAAVLYGDTEFWFSWMDKADQTASDYKPGLGVETETLYQPPALFVRFFLRQDAAVPCTCSVLIRREAVERTGGFEESFRAVFTDQAFYAKLFFRESAYVADKCWDKYRQHPNSSVQVAHKQGTHKAAEAFFLKWLESYLKEQRVKEPIIWEELQKRMWRHRHPVRTRIASARKQLRERARQVIPLPIRKPFSAMRKKLSAR